MSAASDATDPQDRPQQVGSGRSDAAIGDAPTWV
jgi:hypothetical protein